MTVFRLMREAHENVDNVTNAIANAVGSAERAKQKDKYAGHHPEYSIAAGPDPVLFLEFWEMKRTGELALDETPACWAILMRAVPIRLALRALFENATTIVKPSTIPQQPKPIMQLLHYLHEVKQHLAGLDRPQDIAKLRGNLVGRLQEAAACRWHIAPTLDPIDAGLVLSACEAVLVAEQEEQRRWTR